MDEKKDQREPYVKPALVEYGRAEDITMTYGMAGGDGLGGAGSDPWPGS